MSYRVLNSRTAKRQASERAKLLRWRRDIRELCPAAPVPKFRQKSHTKKGPGRVNADKVEEGKRRRIIERARRRAAR